MDTINKKYFNNPYLFGKAMELLMKYEAVEFANYGVAQAFFDQLDEGDSELLELALKQREIDSRGNNQNFQVMKEMLARWERGESSQISETESKNNPRLSVLISNWLNIKKSKLATSSYQTTEPRIHLFEDALYEISGSKTILISQITPDLIREYRELLEKLPAKRSGGEFKGKTIRELAGINAEKISSKTYLYNLDTAKQFLNWARLEGYQVNERLEGILQVARKNTSAVAKTQRVPFTAADLKKIFEGVQYTDCKLKRASDYWVPLIALFTGARLGEICQILVGDIEELEGVWCIKITDTGDDDKRLKAKGSERIVPLHNQLIKLGFMDYRETMEKRGAKLFPDEVRDDSGRFSAFQKRMTHFFKGLSLEVYDGESKGFHSFRHLVRTELVELNINEGLIDSIVGHTSNERSIGSKFYTHTQQINQKMTAIQLLDYGVDFSKLVNWRQFRFARFY